MFIRRRPISPAYIFPTIHIQYLTPANPSSEQFAVSFWRSAISILYIEARYAKGTFEQLSVEKSPDHPLFE